MADRAVNKLSQKVNANCGNHINNIISNADLNSNSSRRNDPNVHSAGPTLRKHNNNNSSNMFSVIGHRNSTVEDKYIPNYKIGHDQNYHVKLKNDQRRKRELEEQTHEHNFGYKQNPEAVYAAKLEELNKQEAMERHVDQID